MLVLITIWSPPPEFGRLVYVTTSAPKVIWVFLGAHVSTLDVFLLLDPSYAVAHKLFVFSASSYPMEGHSAIQPTVRLPYRKSLQSLLGVMDKVSGHVPGHQLQAATRPWLVREYCCTTAKTAAETPFPMASPKAWRSMDWIISWNCTRLLGATTRSRRLRSHFDHLFIRSPGSCVSQATQISQASRIFPHKVSGETSPRGS